VQDNLEELACTHLSPDEFREYALERIKTPLADRIILYLPEPILYNC